MMVTALLLRPWLCQMLGINAQPRILADDIMITTTGQTTHLRKIVPAVEATFTYITDIGGRIAPHKSALFSSTSVARTVLRQHTWNAIDNQKVKVMLDFRDLGAHLNTTARTTGATLTARLTKALRTFRITNYLPIDTKQKYQALRTKGLPYALYGCESHNQLATALWLNSAPPPSMPSVLTPLAEHSTLSLPPPPPMDLT